MPEPAACTYELDVDLRIVAVDSRWSEFAVANGAPELVPPPGPLGQSAVLCVADSTSALLYRRLFHRVLETKRPISFPIRCDAPELRRFLQLVIEPRQPDGLRISTTVTRTERRPVVAMLDHRHPRSGDLLRMCAWCKSVDVEGRWCEVEEAVLALRLFDYDVLPTITHGMCPLCYERMNLELELR